MSTATASLNYDFGLAESRLREEGDKLVISGIASNWDLDRAGDRMARFAFDRSLKRYLETNPILLYSHRYSMPMGQVTKAYVDEDGLHVTAELPKPEPGTESMNIWQLVKGGVIRAFSVGGRPTRSVINGIKTILDWDIREVSIAPVGVNSGTLFSLSQQVGKAFGDAPPDLAQRAGLASLRAELAVMRAELAVIRADAR